MSPEDLFVVAEVSKRRVYENEPVVVQYRLFTRVSVSSYSITQAAGSEGFWVEDVPQTQSPQVEQVVRDGTQYATAALKHVVLFPTGPGTKTVEPLSVEARVRVQQRSRDPFEDFFNRSSLFGSLVPTVVASDPVDIEVLPLPEAGRPRELHGSRWPARRHGFRRSSRCSNERAVTLSVTVSGEGNLRALAAPTIDFSRDFEVFPRRCRSPSTDAGLASAGPRSTTTF